MQQAVVISDIAPLYKQPTTQTELTDEALYGMVVDLLENVDDNWVKVRTHYRYEGYTPKHCLLEDEQAVQEWEHKPKRTVRAPYIDVRVAPDVLAAKCASVPRGGRLYTVEGPDRDGWVPVLLADGRHGYVKASHLCDCLTKPDKSDEETLRMRIVENAMAYLGTQYRWGGKTPLGIDCSGLSSMAYMMCGSTIYRDAAIRPDFEMRQIELEDIQMGDLIFFPGHVAVYIGHGEYVHSTAKAGSDGVVINSLDPDSPRYREDLHKSITAVGTIF